MHRPSTPVAPVSTRESLRRWLLAGGVFLALLFFFSPSWGAFSLWSRVPEMSAMLEVRRGASVLEQVAHPGAEIADPLHRVIQWRLLFPLIGRVLHLPVPLFFGLAYAGCVAALAFVIVTLRRRGVAWRDCALAAVMLGAGSWVFTSTGWLGYWDAWLALALLVTAFARDRRWVWFACLWAPWADERFVLAAPLALLCRWILARTEDPEKRFDWRLEFAVPAALMAAFAAVRLGVLAHQSAAGATMGGYMGSRDFLDAPLPRIALGVWEGLRAGWFWAGAGLVLLWRNKLSNTRNAALLLGACTAALIFAGLFTAQDYSRSMTMVLPVALLGLLLAFRPGAGAGWRPRALAIGAAAALLLPAHHVMNDRVNPIFYLYRELAALHTPPRAAMPELHELQAIHEMERGEFAAAEADLTLAIKLAPNPASPAKQRGILLASQGRWADALRDFSLMVENDPANPDAWLMRAQAQLATGQTVAARADIDKALSLAPNGWSARPDVTRFLAKLNRTP